MFFNNDLKDIKKFPKDSIVIADKVKITLEKTINFFIEGSEKLKSFENLNIIIKKYLN